MHKTNIDTQTQHTGIVVVAFDTTNNNSLNNNNHKKKSLQHQPSRIKVKQFKIKTLYLEFILTWICRV